MDQTFNALFQFNECAVIGDVRHTAGQFRADRVFLFNAGPRIGFQLFHAQADTLRFGVETDNLNLDGLTDRQRFGRVINAFPGNVGDMQQTVNAAQVNERAVIGDVLDNAVQNLAFGQILDQFGTLFDARFFQNGAAGNNDVSAGAVHFQNLERLRRAHQRTDVAYRTNVNLRPRQKRDRAGQINRKAAFDAAENNACNAFAVGLRFFQFVPSFFATSFFTGQDNHTVFVFVTVDKDIDLIADFHFCIKAEFAAGNAAF